jgi:DNA-directed RNA polymerase subunit F
MIMEIKDEKFVSWSEGKAILLKKEKEGEPGYEQKNALEHLRKFSNLSQKNLKEMEEALRKIERLKEKHLVSIVNMLPENPDELRLIFANEVITLSDDDKKKILSIVKKCS